MITNFLLDHSALVPLALLLVAVICAVLGHVVTRLQPQWPVKALLLVSVLPVLALTLVPAANSSIDRVMCTVQFAVPTLGSVELLANVALFIPPVYFAALLTRRPLPVLAVGAAASAVIETLQALIPPIGRACDTNDWLMNTVGAALGALLAAGTLAMRARTKA